MKYFLCPARGTIFIYDTYVLLSDPAWSQTGESVGEVLNKQVVLEKSSAREKKIVFGKWYGTITSMRRGSKRLFAMQEATSYTALTWQAHPTMWAAWPRGGSVGLIVLPTHLLITRTIAPWIQYQKLALPIPTNSHTIFSPPTYLACLSAGHTLDLVFLLIREIMVWGWGSFLLSSCYGHITFCCVVYLQGLFTSTKMGGLTIGPTSETNGSR